MQKEPTQRWQRVPLAEAGTRPTLLWVRREHNRLNATHLTSRQVAEEAGVPLAISYAAELGAPVERADAQKILAAFARLTGHRYTPQEIALHLRPPHLSPQEHTHE